MGTDKKTVEIIGVPSDLGANVRGSNIGPSALRIAGLKEKIETLSYTVVDSGDISVPVRETVKDQDQKIKYRKEVAEICVTLKGRVLKSLVAGHLPIILGGDHSLAMGSIAGVREYYDSKKKEFGLIWIDAHADLNTPESSPSGNVHGMPLAALLGMGSDSLTTIGKHGAKLRPSNVALVGIRILDPKEKEILKQVGIRYFTMREIDERGMGAVMKEAISIASTGTDGIHLSFDLDGIDPIYAPGVSTPVAGGLSYREAHLALELLADHRSLTSMEFVELNPIQDAQHITANLAVELIQSALGKSIV